MKRLRALINMFVATFVVELPGGAQLDKGAMPFELPLLSFVATFALLFVGPGSISVDYRLGSALAKRGPNRHLRSA